MIDREDKKLIKQRRSDDCGVAALAMLFETSYEKMHRYVLIPSYESGKPWDGTPKEYARRVGEILGDSVRVWYASDSTRPRVAEKLRGRPAVLVVPAKGYPIGTEYHAVYWDGKRLYDPNGHTGKSSYGRDGKLALQRFEEAWVKDSDR